MERTRQRLSCMVLTSVTILLTSALLLHPTEASSISTTASIISASAASNLKRRNKGWITKIPRGGSSAPVEEEEEEEEAAEHDDDDEEEAAAKQAAELENLRLSKVKYFTDQSLLYQLRSTYLSEALASRGIPLTTLVDVRTKEGDKPPQPTDWDCALCTVDEPKSCLYSFDAEPNTKVISPIGTTQWIALSALNRLRRTDPTKVEPMWHSQYAILSSWFSDSSPYSLMSYVGFKGFVLSTIILDFGNGMVLRSLLLLALTSAFVICMPLLEYVVSRIMVSGLFWSKWPTWGRIVHAALPLKLLIGQLLWKGMAKSFNGLEGRVKDFLVDLECSILEESVPVTVGEVGSEEEIMVENGDEDEDGFGIEEEEEDLDVDEEEEEDLNDYDEYDEESDDY